MSGKSSLNYFKQNFIAKTLSDNDWRNCDACRQSYAKKRTAQIMVETIQRGQMFVLDVSASEYQKLQKNWNKRKQRAREKLVDERLERYRERGDKITKQFKLEQKELVKAQTLPLVAFIPFVQKSGRICLVHSSEADGGELVPHTVDEIYTLVMELTKSPAPSSKRVRPSKHFGKRPYELYEDGENSDWSYFDRNEEFAQFLSDDSVETLAAMLDTTVDEQNRVRKSIEAQTAYDLLAEHGASQKRRKNDDGLIAEQTFYDDGQDVDTARSTESRQSGAGKKLMRGEGEADEAQPYVQAKMPLDDARTHHDYE